MEIRLFEMCPGGTCVLYAMETMDTYLELIAMLGKQFGFMDVVCLEEYSRKEYWSYCKCLLVKVLCY